LWWEAKERKRELQCLPEDTFGLISDWMMKFELFKYRESMAEFFGKAGIATHGSVFLRRVLQDFEAVTILAAGNDKAEDAFSALSNLDLAIPMYLALPGHDSLKKAILPTDGAGCFSGKLFCLSVPIIFARHNIQLRDHFTGESGGNKSQLDGRFAVAKRGAREVAVAGRGTRDITDAWLIFRNVSPF
jgi:hypothetical protein